MCVRARACVRVRACTVRGACRMLEDERDLVRAADGLARMAALVAHPEFDAILDGAEFIGLCQAHELAAMPRYENRRRTKKTRRRFSSCFVYVCPEPVLAYHHHGEWASGVLRYGR